METQHPQPNFEHQDQSSSRSPQPQAPTRRKWVTPLLALVGVAVAAAAVWGILQWRDSDDDAAQSNVGTDAEPEVVVIDESEVDIVQNPSLKATAGGDGVTVKNDGNVTMHDITVTEGDEEVCTFEEMAPGASEVCGGATAAASISGLGPQDQAVDISVG